MPLGDAQVQNIWKHCQEHGTAVVVCNTCMCGVQLDSACFTPAHDAK